MSRCYICDFCPDTRSILEESLINKTKKKLIYLGNNHDICSECYEEYLLNLETLIDED